MILTGVKQRLVSHRPFLPCAELRKSRATCQSQRCHCVRQGRISISCRAFFSLAPGFSRVNSGWRKGERFQPFSAPAATKPLKRLGAASPAPTGLKPGANEKLQ
jgi:hypothetical protein